MKQVLPALDADVLVNATYLDYKKVFDLLNNDTSLRKLAIQSDAPLIYYSCLRAICKVVNSMLSITDASLSHITPGQG